MNWKFHNDNFLVTVNHVISDKRPFLQVLRKIPSQRQIFKKVTKKKHVVEFCMLNKMV